MPNLSLVMLAISLFLTGSDGCNKQKDQASQQISAPKATATGTHSVTLTWTQGTCQNCTITGNKVYRQTGNSCANALVQAGMNSPTNTYTDQSLPGNTTFAYYVTAVSSANTPSESLASNCVSITTPADTGGGGTGPQPVTNLQVTNPASGQAKLTWTPPPDTANKTYNIYRKNTSTPPFNKIASNVTGTSYLDTKAGHGMKYYYVETQEVSAPSEMVNIKLP